MRTVAILLCDNDFGNLFRNLLEAVYNLSIYWGGEITEERVEKFIRASILAYYIGCDYNNANISEEAASMAACLNKWIKVQFNEEAEKSILELDHDGGSWYLNLIEGKVYSF